MIKIHRHHHHHRRRLLGIIKRKIDFRVSEICHDLSFIEIIWGDTENTCDMFYFAESNQHKVPPLIHDHHHLRENIDPVLLETMEDGGSSSRTGKWPREKSKKEKLNEN